MAVVTFDVGMFLHDAADDDDYIAAGRRDPQYSSAPQGAVSMSAAGRRRWTSRPGRSETFNVTVRTRDEDVRGWIDDHQGVTVLYRDRRGRRAYGIIVDAQVSDIAVDVSDITLTFAPIDI